MTPIKNTTKHAFTALIVSAGSSVVLVTFLFLHLDSLAGLLILIPVAFVLSATLGLFFSWLMGKIDGVD
jgi:hypothetical protein